jgi:hypothetical protein
MLALTVSFDLDFTDPLTKERFPGTFKAKTKLTQREMLAESSMVRQILGFNPKEAEDGDKRRANAIAYCAIRITDGPKWWTDSDSGLELNNTSLLAELYNKCDAAITAEYEKLTKEAEVARKEIKEEIK